MYYSALLGKPIDHSISPTLFGLLGEELGVEYGHIKIEVDNKEQLKEYLNYLKELKFSGVNITLPYKIEVIPFIDRLDDSAAKCGAVNTIIFEGKELIGFNTDAFGAIMAIKSQLRKIKTDDKILMIGAGGAARAIVYEIYKRSPQITILNIDSEQALKLSKDLSEGKIKVNVLNNENLIKEIERANFIINATPVGMFPNNTEKIIPVEVFNQFNSLKDKYFFDAIFNPYKTKFLQMAEAKGAKVCSGLYMMIYQAIAAFKLWTGITSV